MTSLRARVDQSDWAAITQSRDDLGVAATGPLLTPAECRDLVERYDEPGRYRSTVDMARHRFGAGEYRYFDSPLPAPVTELRAAFWPHLLPVARTWAARREEPSPWPDSFDDWLEQCHTAGQQRPTPLILRYGPGDWNALHRDLYGDLVFPLQVVIALNEPEVDYTGGEFVVVEQRPRSQSRATAMVIPRGHGYVFTTRDRPVQTQRGWTKAPMRHGLSVVRSGERHALGLIFHDAT
jgi:hypothetical protein